MDSKQINLPKEEILKDFYLSYLSRQVAFIGRKEVLSGKAKFGIFGDGKEVAQVAFARYFKEGDWRSGYYRDHPFMIAAGIVSPEQFFHQLYGLTDSEKNPGNAGRNFNNHFATPNIDKDGNWKELAKMKNACSDLAPTAGQMPRLVGLGYASKLFKQNKDLHSYSQFSHKGNEVAFGTIGDASTAEGMFFETINAAAVLKIPVAISVWDDGYGISVTKDLQVAKADIGKALEGFKREKGTNGIEIYRVKGWDYPGLIKAYSEGIELCRKEHVPVLFHVDEMIQPYGHSTSGSHERYKSKERLQWEKEHDPLAHMEEWILKEKIATEDELNEIKIKAKKEASDARDASWKAFTGPLKEERDRLLEIIDNRTCKCKTEDVDKLGILSKDLKRIMYPIRRDIQSTAKRIMRNLCQDCPQRSELQNSISGWLKDFKKQNYEKYSSLLYNEGKRSALKILPIEVELEDNKFVNGREILRDNFDALFAKEPRLVTFGEDTGRIGDVNKALEGLHEKYGDLRVTDTGIRETTIIGQGVGLALRGLRPIAEIQYFDYLLYALATLSDDLATLHWRTKGLQSAPLIIRTRGHRLEGIWHAGSPMSMVINSIRGIYVCVPRNMTQAAGMYNTLLEADDPALVIEPLKGYGLKEPKPKNFGEFRVPLGKPEILVEGSDVTLVTYGSCVRIAENAIRQLSEFDISVELIDVQTLLPFDLDGVIGESVRKTNKVVFFDEDVPGGASAFMMKHVLENQKAYYHLDAEPRTLTAHEHRPAYSSDGDYYSNPNAEDVFEMIYEIMHEYNPQKYPEIY